MDSLFLADDSNLINIKIGLNHFFVVFYLFPLSYSVSGRKSHEFIIPSFVFVVLLVTTRMVHNSVLAVRWSPLIALSQFAGAPCQNTSYVRKGNNNALANSHFAAQWPGLDAFTPFMSKSHL